MIIEVAGVDGSGKTTLIQGLRRAINEGGVAFAYERAFQSEGVRLLEAAASASGRKRPGACFSKSIVEHVRVVDLVRRSFELLPYKASTTQHVFTDSYIVEQRGRLFQANLLDENIERLLSISVRPALLLYLKISPQEAVRRMRSRPKGDSILLADEPERLTAEVISGLEQAIESNGARCITLDAAAQPAELVTEALQHISATCAALPPT